MSKKRGYRADVMMVDEAIPEEVKEEVKEEVIEVVEEVKEEVIEVIEEVKEVKEEAEPKKPIYTVSSAGTVIPWTLNVRKRPSKESEVVKVIRKNDDVEILDESTANGWSPVLLADGTKGYCLSEFIKVNN